MDESPAALAERQRKADEKETGRVEAFSDGVIAIAITLLTFDLRPPSPEALAQFGLIGALLQSWPIILAFIVGFATILVMWVNHHRLFTVIRRSDDVLLMLNGWVLLGIAVVPFPTKLAAEYLRHPEANTAVFIYCMWGLFIAFGYNLLWRYASHDNRLFSPRTDPSLVSAISRQYMFGPVFYLVAALVALVNGLVAMLICLLLAAFFAMPNSAFRKLNASGS
jgi:uncharacterized membrane protein